MMDTIHVCYHAPPAREPDHERAAIAHMLPDEFLEWGLHQKHRYELVDGVPYTNPPKD